MPAALQTEIWSLMTPYVALGMTSGRSKDLLQPTVEQWPLERFRLLEFLQGIDHRCGTGREGDWLMIQCLKSVHLV
jgi:hypothetical protein